MNEKLLEQVQKYVDKEFFDLAPIREMEKQGARFSIGKLTYGPFPKPRKPSTWLDIIKEKLGFQIGKSEEEDSFAARLFRLIQQKQITEVDVYKKAHLDRRLFSKIRTDKEYMPSKKTVLALIIALQLNEDEADDLLHRAGYAMSCAIKEDVIVRYFIVHQQYDLFVVNEFLYYYGFKPLGD